jgi:hypothetical protein
MECLQLVVPPIPQFLTVGHSHWSPGGSHFSRKFQVYDMLFVKKGSLYITENGQPYEISPQKMLILEAGKTHWGFGCARKRQRYIGFTLYIRILVVILTLRTFDGRLFSKKIPMKIRFQVSNLCFCPNSVKSI